MLTYNGQQINTHKKRRGKGNPPLFDSTNTYCRTAGSVFVKS